MQGGGGAQGTALPDAKDATGLADSSSTAAPAAVGALVAAALLLAAFWLPQQGSIHATSAEATASVLLRNNATGWGLDAPGMLLELERISAGGCNLDRVSPQEFKKRLKSGSFQGPVIVSNASLNMQGCGAECAAAWTRSNFLSAFGGLQVTAEPQLNIALFGPKQDPMKLGSNPVSLAEIINGFESGSGTPLAFDATSTLMETIRKQTPGWSKKGKWPSVFSRHKDMQILSLGGSRSGLSFHDHGPAVLWLVHGRKRWFIMPPGTLPPELEADGRNTYEWLAGLRAGGEPDAAGTTPPSPLASANAVSPAARYAGLIQCTQEPGEIVLVPHRWHHATVNIGTAVGFGGQAFGDDSESLNAKDIDARIAANPAALGWYTEKLAQESVRRNPPSALRILAAAKVQHPNNAKLCTMTIDHLCSYALDPSMPKSKAKELAAQTANETRGCWDMLVRLEDCGMYTRQQVGRLLGSFAMSLAQQGAANSPALHDRVFELFRESLRRNEADVASLFGLAYVHGHSKDGDKQEAVSLLRRCVAIEPSAAQCNEGLRALAA